MNLNDKDKDFIDSFVTMTKSYQSQGIRFVAFVLIFILLFFIGIFLAPTLISVTSNMLRFSVHLLQLSPMEVLFNYIKIGFFFSSFCIFPFFIYQFGKMQIDKENIEEKMNLLLSSLILAFIIIVSSFLVYRFIIPAEIYFLYGMNFHIAEFSSSLSSMVSAFIFTLLLTIMILLLPFMKFLIKKSLFFNYATFIKNRKPIIIYCGIIASLIALPMEIFSVGFIFLICFLWYKVLVHFSKTRG